MPDVIDAFVVTLGLDPREYQREIKNYRDDRKRLADEEAKQNRVQDDAQKRTVQGFRAMRNEAVGFLAVLAGANSVKDFASNILTGDAATGRFAANMGLATERVGAWEEAVKRAGGTAQEGRQMVGAMASAFQSLQLMGTTGHDADFQGLGVTSRDLQSPEGALLKIAEASQRMPRAEFTARLQRLGFSDAGITLLSKGRHELELLLVQMEKQGVASDKSAEAAIEFDNALNDITQTLKGQARPAVDEFAGFISKLAADEETLNIVTNVSIGLLGAAALAAIAAYGPFILLAGAVALLASEFDKSDSSMRAWSQTAKGVKQIMGGDVSGGLGTLWEEFKTEASETLDDINEFAGTPDRNGRKGRLAAREVNTWNRNYDAMGNRVGQSRTVGPASGGLRGGGGDLVAFFRSRGYSHEQARGIAAGIMAESGGNHKARNPTSGAYGLGQHLSADRRANFRKRYGIDITQSTREQQLDFIDWELKGGDLGGKAVRGQTTAAGTLQAYITKFMRPAAGAETAGDMRRGMAWLRSNGGASGGMQTVNNTTNVGEITVYTPGTDAKGIARDIRGELSKRGLVVQANTGLQP